MNNPIQITGKAKKKKLTVFTVGLCLLIALGSYSALASSSSAPGSAGDPLVSKSYVDDKFNSILSILSAFNDSLPAIGQPGDVSTATSYTPVSVGIGQAIIGGEGTEIILRSGKAIGYCPGENGMVNITTGYEVYNGDNILQNHMLIVPRDDGRGALVVADAWFMVKGDYKIIRIL